VNDVPVKNITPSGLNECVHSLVNTNDLVIFDLPPELDIAGQPTTVVVINKHMHIFPLFAFIIDIAANELSNTLDDGFGRMRPSITVALYSTDLSFSGIRSSTDIHSVIINSIKINC
jgi:hypothetical protein